MKELPRLRLRVSPASESRLRAGHPWLYADSIRGQNRPGQQGELAIIYDRRDEFLAAGLFDPDSPIRVRVLHAGRPQTIDAAWWEERLRLALAKREGICDPATNACRWLHGESDGWPGLVLDRYDATLVLKIYTAAWLPRLADLLPLFHAVLRPETVILRLSRNIQAVAHERFGRVDGETLCAPGAALVGAGSRDAPAPVSCRQRFLETGLQFEADLVKGQKTGFFLDQRENRRRVERLAPRRAVLNAFSFSGGFSLYAARGGAASVLDLDISAHALEGARRNFSLNMSVPAIARCAHDTVQADAFAWLERKGPKEFGLVILDPPALAKRAAERAGAVAAYGRLAANGMGRLLDAGILVAASCSAHVPASEFFEVVLREASRTGRPFRERERTTQPIDHPATFPEAEYLKCIYLEFCRATG